MLKGKYSLIETSPKKVIIRGMMMMMTMNTHQINFRNNIYSHESFFNRIILCIKEFYPVLWIFPVFPLLFFINTANDFHRSTPSAHPFLVYTMHGLGTVFSTFFGNIMNHGTCLDFFLITLAFQLYSITTQILPQKTLKLAGIIEKEGTTFSKAESI